MTVALQPEEAERLAEAELRWRLTIDNAPIGIALVGLDGRWLHVNPALCRLVGYREDELLASSFQAITHPDDLDADLTLLAQLVRGEIDHYTLEKRYLHAHGYHVWIRLVVALARRPDGEPLHFIAQIEDVTEQRRMSQRLSGIIASARNAFISVDTAGHVTEWNAAAEAMFGWSRDEALGQICNELCVPPKHRAVHAEGLARLAADDGAQILDRRLELRAQRRDGTCFPVEVSIWRIEDESNEYHCFVRDLSDSVAARLAAEQEAERQAALIAAQLDLAQVELSPSKVMSRICDKARELTGADHAVIEIVEGDDMVYRAATNSFERWVGLHLPLDTSISGRSVRSGQALICVDAFTDPRVDGASCEKVGVRSMLLTPLRHDGRVVGVLKVLSAQRGAFTAEHREVLGILATPFASAMSNAWTLESTALRSASDPLTGLSSRGHALAALKRALDVDDPGATTAVLFVDLDRFKNVNDDYGHAAGDELLRLVAQRVRSTLRPADVAGRLGGDEFLVIGSGLRTVESAEALGQRLIGAITAPYRLAGGLAAEAGASIGVALVHGRAEAPVALAAADQAMYEAKRAGGNRCRSRVLGVPSEAEPVPTGRAASRR